MEQVSMTVEDKGAGFDQNMLALRGGQSSGIGLFGISERLSYIGGRMEIDSAPGLGSRFRLIVPILRSKHGGGPGRSGPEGAGFCCDLRTTRLQTGRSEKENPDRAGG